MLTFFRSLRQKLLGENRFKNYLVYALGEIILVMIGILLAVQVNDWASSRKDDKQRAQLLTAVKYEFEQNLSQLNEVIHYQDYILDAAYTCMELMRENTYPERVQGDSLLQRLAYIWTFDPRYGAVRSGISSGEIHLIKNDSLLNLLFGWEDVIKDLAENEDRAEKRQIESQMVFNDEIRQAGFMRIFSPGIKTSRFEFDYSRLFDNPGFEDYLAWRIVDVEDVKDELLSVRDHNMKIIELVNRELADDGKK